ncbi:hypothetical protein MZM54_01895 [[Brevibacterium] frigoritolerans]|nr:hypothetical protein [Peribacillus frigoritolerans]
MTQTTYQVFNSEDELKQFVIDMDPMKEFEPVKREINWNPGERECNECHKTFTPIHPATHFCSECATKVDKKNKRESIIARMKKNPSIEKCENCKSEFYKTAPAMRNCETCSPRGGELVKKEKNKTSESKSKVIPLKK